MQHEANTDPFVRWYRSAEAEAAHRASAEFVEAEREAVKAADRAAASSGGWRLVVAMWEGRGGGALVEDELVLEGCRSLPRT